MLPMHRPAVRGRAIRLLARLAGALERLEKLHPFAKKVVIEGLVKTVAHDETLNVSEAELLRTVCASLHCPLPPLPSSFHRADAPSGAPTLNSTRLTSRNRDLPMSGSRKPSVRLTSGE